MPEGVSAQPTRLVVLPDFDDPRWTHFRAPCGEVGVLQELPRPLRIGVSGFVGALIACGIERVDLYIPGQMLVRSGRTSRRERPFTQTLTLPVQRSLDLLAWWLLYNHRQGVAGARQRCGMDSAYNTWHCPDCGESVEAGRDYCTNSSCPSWNKLNLCTGETVLHLVPRAT